MNADPDNGVVDAGISDAASRRLYQELRLALVFNGGVSLAVWMGGVAKEIDRFRCAFTGESSQTASRLGPYRDLLDAMRTVVLTDVIAGASAGGINGALLAYVLANGKSLECAGQDEIRDTWQTLGSMDNLLYTSGEPPSILKTNEVLFSGCARVFSKLQAAPMDLSDDVSRWVRLTITATDTHGYQVSAKGLSGAISGPDHRLQMRFRHVVYPSGDTLRLSPALRARIAAVVGEPAPPPGEWPFPQPASSRDLAGPDAAAFLTRAARTTSSFPIAFAPSELPLNYQTPTVGFSPDEALTATPPMAQIVEAPAGPNLLEPVTGDPGKHIARYAIDGGVWDNSPFSAVLRSVERTPSGRDVRRVLAYVVGTREPPPDNQAVPEPTLAGALLQAIALPADLSFANDLTRIRDDQAGQKGSRVNVLGLLGAEVVEGGVTQAMATPPDVFQIARELFPLYQKTFARPETPLGALVSPPVRAAEALPEKNASLAEWWATSDGWGWGPQPVRNSVQEARRLLRPLLRKVATAGAAAAVPEGTVDALIGARELLSQLTWALDDLTDRLNGDAAAPTAECAAICGQAMRDFGECVAGLSPSVAAINANPGLAGSFAAAATLTSGGPEMVVKRALALDIVLTTLSSQTTETVDYGLTAIRPQLMWPDAPSSPPGSGDDGRPPLAGATFNHFGGFLRASWRLNDWMWGRIDGNQAIVDLLLTGDHLGRLVDPGNDHATADLARGIARFVVPDPVDSDSYLMSRTLALDAFTTQGLPTLADGGPETAEAVNAATDRQPRFVTRWQQELAGVYAAQLRNIAKDPATTDLAARDRLRADVGRRFRFTIMDEEVPSIVVASESEGGSLLPAAEIRRDRNVGLRTITPATLSKPPRTLELLQDGENGVADVLFATRDKRVWVLAASLRALAEATSWTRATFRAIHVVRHYTRHRKS